MSKFRWLSVLGVTAVYGVWLYHIGRQYLPMLLLLSHALFAGGIIYLLWPRLQKGTWWYRTLTGAGVGYTASVFAAATITLTRYGGDQFFDRFFPSSLYVYPLISFGWLYGMMIVAALCWRLDGSTRTFSE